MFLSMIASIACASSRNGDTAGGPRGTPFSRARLNLQISSTPDTRLHSEPEPGDRADPLKDARQIVLR